MGGDHLLDSDGVHRLFLGYDDARGPLCPELTLYLTPHRPSHSSSYSLLSSVVCLQPLLSPALQFYARYGQITRVSVFDVSVHLLFLALLPLACPFSVKLGTRGLCNTWCRLRSVL